MQWNVGSTSCTTPRGYSNHVHSHSFVYVVNRTLQFRHCISQHVVTSITLTKKIGAEIDRKCRDEIAKQVKKSKQLHCTHLEIHILRNGSPIETSYPTFAI